MMGGGKIFRTSKIGSRTSRAYLLDELRGLSIILMVIYHFFFNLVFIFGVNIPAFHAPLLDFLQPFFAGVFILISGMVCRYSRSNLKRGAVLMGLALGLSIVTINFMPEQAIYFGILHLLASAMILFALLEKPLGAVTVLPGMLIFTLLFAVTFNISRGYLGFFNLHLFELPQFGDARWMIPIGLMGIGADYFGLIPWLFLFFAGTYLGIPCADGQMPRIVYRGVLPWLGAVGRKTIYIYLLHQPVLYGGLWLFFRLIA